MSNARGRSTVSIVVPPTERVTCPCHHRLPSRQWGKTSRIHPPYSRQRIDRCCLPRSLSRTSQLETGWSSRPCCNMLRSMVHRPTGISFTWATSLWVGLVLSFVKRPRWRHWRVKPTVVRGFILQYKSSPTDALQTLSSVWGLPLVYK